MTVLPVKYYSRRNCSQDVQPL